MGVLGCLSILFAICTGSWTPILLFGVFAVLAIPSAINVRFV